MCGRPQCVPMQSAAPRESADMGGKLGKKGQYMVKENLEDPTAEGPGTEMEEPASGNDRSESGAQALQEEGDASSSQVPLEQGRLEQRDAASDTEECESADSPVGMASKRGHPGEMAMPGSEQESPAAPYLCLTTETGAAASEEDPMMTPPPSLLSEHRVPS